MIGSLTSGVSGLASHQKMLEVVGNNISNVNTNGYKRDSYMAMDSFNQTLQEAVAPNATAGGLNPIQLGSGVTTGAIQVDFSQGAIQQTGRALDLALEGPGFFVVRNETTNLFTRVGNFALDADNQLVDQATGFQVQSAQGDVIINQEEPFPPQATASITTRGNLDETTTFPGGTVSTSIGVFDGVGQTHTMQLTFTRNNATQWDMVASLPGGGGTFVNDTVAGITFNADGSFASSVGNSIDVTFNGVTQNVTFDFGTAGPFDGLTQLATASTASAVEQDGFGLGNLISLAVNPDGAVVGQYSNGQNRNFAQLAVATFDNPEGLKAVGNNMFTVTGNSGLAVIGLAQEGRAGSVVSGALEGSNVDISNEIAQMIVAQRGFQVNARVIKASDEVLQELANLTR